MISNWRTSRWLQIGISLFTAFFIGGVYFYITGTPLLTRYKFYDVANGRIKTYSESLGIRFNDKLVDTEFTKLVIQQNSISSPDWRLYTVEEFGIGPVTFTATLDMLPSYFDRYDNMVTTAQTDDVTSMITIIREVAKDASLSYERRLVFGNRQME